MAAPASSPTISLRITIPKSPKSILHHQPQCSFLCHHKNLRGFAFSSGTIIQKTSKLHATPEAAGDLLSSLTSHLPDIIPGFHLPGFGGDNNSWLAGVVGLCVAVPLLVQRLMSFTKEIDVAAQTVENIAHMVKHVAEEVDKAAEGIEEALPDGGLKKMVHVVEELAEETAKDAHKVEELMDRVEEMDEKLEDFLGKQFNGTEKA